MTNDELEFLRNVQLVLEYGTKDDLSDEDLAMYNKLKHQSMMEQKEQNKIKKYNSK